MSKKQPPQKQAAPRKPATAGSEATRQLDKNRVPPGQEGEFLTTNFGVRISDNHNSLKAGPRGPTLLEDFVLREKITHFDHERIPERVVHARGAGAFGTFECTDDLSDVTTAGFLGKVGKKTPMLVRFSTVAGSKGSMDTARDVRGFSARFYTDEGNYDLVGNNIPVFFIHDAIKFPDLVHSVKPEPNNEIPQAASAHDTFWDFISLMPESTHMIFWVMSDRGIPRSYRMMEGFGVHTFRFVNEEGEGTFVKFHWKPRLGIHGITWEESMNLGGQDPDFHRRDLFDNIESGAFPQWDLCVQLVPEKDEHLYPFDLLDPTKLIPEDLVPVRKVGTMTLNRNPDNYFSEIEQVAFHPGNLIPGIDVTNDPLLQGRLFSYIDTQITRLGGPNFHELPVNRPLTNVHNNQRDGFGRQHIALGRVAYEPNSLNEGKPAMADAKSNAYVHYTEKMDAHKVRARSTSFNDHFSQAKLFFDSLTPPEQDHIRLAITFELSKVETLAIRERMVGALSNVNAQLAEAIAGEIGVKVPKNPGVQPNPADPENNIVPENRATETALSDEEETAPKNKKKLPKTSDALSMVKTAKPSIKTRKVALLIADGVNLNEVNAAKDALTAAGATVETIAQSYRPVKGIKGEMVSDKTFENATSLMYDSMLIVGGEAGAEALFSNGKAIRFLMQTLKHCKPIGALSEGAVVAGDFLGQAEQEGLPGVVLSDDFQAGLKKFIQAASVHRYWDREPNVQNLAV